MAEQDLPSQVIHGGCVSPVSLRKEESSLLYRVCFPFFIPL